MARPVRPFMPDLWAGEHSTRPAAQPPQVAAGHHEPNPA